MVGLRCPCCRGQVDGQELVEVGAFEDCALRLNELNPKGVSRADNDRLASDDAKTRLGVRISGSLGIA